MRGQEISAYDPELHDGDSKLYMVCITLINGAVTSETVKKIIANVPDGLFLVSAVLDENVHQSPNHLDIRIGKDLRLYFCKQKGE